MTPLVLHINLLVIETLARLHGAQGFIETMNDGILAVEEKEHHYLELFAREGNWEYGLRGGEGHPE